MQRLERRVVGVEGEPANQHSDQNVNAVMEMRRHEHEAAGDEVEGHEQRRGGQGGGVASAVQLGDQPRMLTIESLVCLLAQLFIALQ